MKTEAVTGQSSEIKQAFPRGRWTLPGNPFKGERNTRASGAARPMQGELSLDNVKPVRNDLSDTDLELVPLVKKAAEERQSNVFGGNAAAPASGGKTVFGRLADWVRSLKPGK